MSRRCDSDYEDEHFECADAGAADTFPMQAGDLKKGEHVVIRGRPCKIVSHETFKVGKHGHSKASIEGEDIFTGRKYELVCPASYPLPCPFVTKTEYMLIDIQEDGQLSLLDEDCEQRCDLDLPLENNESLARAIRGAFDNGKSLTLVAHKAMGMEAIMRFQFDTAR